MPDTTKKFKDYVVGDIVDVSHRLNTAYITGSYMLVSNGNGYLGVWIQTDTKDFYPDTVDTFEFKSLRDILKQTKQDTQIDKD